MNSCDEYAIKTLRYLDNDLEGQEREDFLSHLASCVNCRAHVEAEKNLSATLHRLRPLYAAPAGLRERFAMAEIETPASSGAQDSIYHQTSRVLRARLSVGLQSLMNWRVLVPAAVAIALCLAFVPNIERRV